LLGILIDGLYQAIEFKTFHPVEALKVAMLLAFVPYLRSGDPSRASHADCNAILLRAKLSEPKAGRVRTGGKAVELR
jgi:hypothetical protein